jgi:hypothetical protein
MDPVAVVAAGAALAAAIWSKKSARAANRSAAAAERSADAAERSAAAEEQSADAAHAQLRYDQERAERERRAHEERVAPRIVPIDDSGEEFMLRADQIIGLITNVGDTAAVLDSATLEHPGGTAPGTFEGSALPCRVGPSVAGAISFHVGIDKLEALPQAGPLDVTLGYRADDSPYHAQVRFVLRRHHANAAGDLQWRADQADTQRLD